MGLMDSRPFQSLLYQSLKGGESAGNGIGLRQLPGRPTPSRGEVSSSRAHRGRSSATHVGKDMGPRPGKGRPPLPAPRRPARVQAGASLMGYSHSPRQQSLGRPAAKGHPSPGERGERPPAPPPVGAFRRADGRVWAVPLPPGHAEEIPGQGTPHTGGPLGRQTMAPRVHHGLIELAGEVRGDPPPGGLG